MADNRIEDIEGGELVTPVDDDLFIALDASDTTDDPDGTVKKIKRENVFNNIQNIFIGGDKEVDGTFRMSVSSGNLQIHKRVSGVYEFVTEFVY